MTNPPTQEALGTLVAATTRSRGGTSVHASPLLTALARPDLGLTPWNPLCHSAITTHRATTGASVTCGTCTAVMARRGLNLGDVLGEFTGQPAPTNQKGTP